MLDSDNVKLLKVLPKDKKVKKVNSNQDIVVCQFNDGVRVHLRF